MLRALQTAKWVWATSLASEGQAVQVSDLMEYGQYGYQTLQDEFSDHHCGALERSFLALAF